MKLKSAVTIVDHFRKHIDSQRIVCEVETGRELSFRQLLEIADRRGSSFYAYDQKIIMVILPNSISYLEYFLSILSTNNIFNPIPYFTSVQELKREIYGQNREVFDLAEEVEKVYLSLLAGFICIFTISNSAI